MLLILAICRTLGASTVVSIKNEGIACASMATAIPKLRTLTGMPHLDRVFASFLMIKYLPREFRSLTSP